MALWYNSKKQEYASDGKNGWFKKYCDKLVSELRKICEAHFAGLSNRHKSADVDYDAAGGATVKDKLDALDGKDGELAQKLESEKEERRTADVGLGTRIDIETNNRKTADEALGKRIDGEISDRKNADTVIDQKITKEIQDRSSMGVTLQSMIGDETSARQTADAGLEQKINTEASTRGQADTALGKRIDDEISARQSADSDLNKNITASYTALQNNLNSEASARQEADDKLKAALDAHTIGMDNKHNAESIDYDDPSGDGINVGVALDTLYGKVENKANQGWITQDGDVWKSIDGVTENGIYSIDYYSGHWTDIPLPNITNNNQSKQNYEPSGLFVFRKAVSGNAEQVFQVIFGIEDEGHGCLIYRKKDNAEAGSWSQWQYADNDVRAVLLEKADFKNSSNGFNAGDQSASTDGGAAAGRLAKTASGGALGSQTESESGFAGGYHAKATGGGAIGHSAETSNGGAVGHNSYAQYGGAVGRGAKGGDGLSAGKDAAVKNIGTSDAPKYIDAIQLGTGTNNNPKTLQVYDYQVTEQGGDGTLHLKDVGNLKDLKTYDKSSIVAAVNESRAIISNVVITDGNELDNLTVTKVYTGTFNITAGEPIPGIGRRDSTDFILKSYGLTNFDLEDYVYQELYFVDDGRSYRIEHYKRFYNYLTETWSDWEKVNDTSGAMATLKRQISSGSSAEAPLNDFVDPASGDWAVTFKIPDITITDDIFGIISLPEQSELMFDGYVSGSFERKYFYAKYNIHNEPGNKISLSFDSVEQVEKTSGAPLSYIEITDGNTVDSVYIYLGYATFVSDMLPDGGGKSYSGSFWWNEETAIPLLYRCI